MVSLLDYYKVGEMMIPSLNPTPPRGTLGAASNQPVFKDGSGNVVTSIECGQPYTFDVPGYTQIWLNMKKDGVQTFDGVFAVPMPSYAASCVTDPGTYQAIAYDLESGMVLGTAQFVVRPAGSGGGGGTPGGGGSTPGPTVSATISPGLIIAGLAALFLFSRRRG